MLSEKPPGSFQSGRAKSILCRVQMASQVVLVSDSINNIQLLEFVQPRVSKLKGRRSVRGKHGTQYGPIVVESAAIVGRKCK